MSLRGWSVGPSGQDGLYDNVAGKGRPQKKKGSGEDEDIYGGLGERAEGLYDDTRGGKGMKYSEDGLYDNPHAMGESRCPCRLIVSTTSTNLHTDLSSAAHNKEALYLIDTGSVFTYLCCTYVCRSRWSL